MMKFSNKDILLLFGILIAVIVALTTMVYTDWSETHQKESEISKPNTSLSAPSALLRKAIDKIDGKLTDPIRSQLD